MDNSARHGLTVPSDMPEVKWAVLSRSVVSDSLQPHGLHPTRLLRPWDSPGKKTGVDCHALLQEILPNPGIEPRSPALQTDSLPNESPGEPTCVTCTVEISWDATGWILGWIFHLI